MTDPDLVLHHFPGVSIGALEWARLPYRVALVNLGTGAQTTSAYRSRSPLGKVPMLEVNGEPLLERAAILILVDALTGLGVRPCRGAARTTRLVVR